MKLNIIGIAAVATVGIAQASLLNLTGTLRDFKIHSETGGHVDFENACCGDDLNIVTSTLSADGKPVYANSPSSWSTHGQAAFDQ